MKKKNKFQKIGILIIVLVVVVLIWVFITNKTPGARRELGFTFEIRDTDVPRFNLEKNPVLPYYFGFFPPGHSFGRSVNITNPESEDMTVHAYAVGNHSEWVNLTFPDVISANSSVEGKFLVNPPADAKFGNYSMAIMIELFKKN